MDARSVIIVSGGIGFGAEQLVRTALSQFPGAHVEVQRIPQVREIELLDDIVARAEASDALIVHTLVRDDLRHALMKLTHERKIGEIDLIGPMLDQLSERLHQEPLRQPGLYDDQHKSYLDRIVAIEYTLAHDDGARADEWEQSDILLTGVSRVGKTPLSMYLAVLGWKVANLPLIREVAPPAELFQMDRSRVIGLTIGLEQLIEHRQWRQHRLGMALGRDYSDPAVLSNELEESDRLFRRLGLPVVDVTGKPLESIANEVIAVAERYRT